MTLNDNVGGGIRGLRPAPSSQLLDEVRRAYGITISSAPTDLGGSSSLNLLVGDSDRFVIRVYRSHVTPDRLDAMNVARRSLSAAGVPTTLPTATRGGHSWIRFEHHLVEVEPYVEHDAHMDAWDGLETGMPILARIHSGFRDIDVPAAGKKPPFANHIESRDVVDRTSQGTRRIRAWGPSAPERRLADDADLLAQLVSKAERPLLGHLPRQLVHGDFWDNNVLFREGDIVHVGDFDFMGERARIDDLALTLYFTCMKFREDPVSGSQLTALRKLLDAYDAGSGSPLTPVERAALPLAIARQPLWSIGIWVAQLDDQESARRHAAGTAPEVAWALRLMTDVNRWQDAFATRA